MTYRKPQALSVMPAASVIEHSLLGKCWGILFDSTFVCYLDTILAYEADE